MSERTPAENAVLALLLEVAATPTPGNVDRHRDLADLRFEHFLASAVGAGGGLRAAERGAPVGEAFERAIAGMAAQSGGNTQFGALLLLVPLVRAAGEGDLSPEGVRGVVEDTTVADAADFYRALDRVDVRVGDPPGGAEDLDARRGSDAVPALENRGLSLYEVLALGDDADDVAREWTHGFDRSFRAGERIADGSGPVTDRAAEAFLGLLAERPDTHVATRHGEETARRVATRARDLLDEDRDRVEGFAETLVEDRINPGTTADVLAAGLFVALERGVKV